MRFLSMIRIDENTGQEPTGTSGTSSEVRQLDGPDFGVEEDGVRA